MTETIEILEFLSRRKCPAFLTYRPKHVGKTGWWYTGGAIPTYPGKIYGKSVAGFYVIRDGRKYYSYIIRTDRGLRRAEHPLF